MFHELFPLILDSHIFWQNSTSTSTRFRLYGSDNFSPFGFKPRNLHANNLWMIVSKAPKSCVRFSARCVCVFAPVYKAGFVLIKALKIDLH